MRSTDQSILGLLLRAYADVAAQRHGEEFIHHNINAMCSYDQALDSIHSAIHSVALADQHVRSQEATKSALKSKEAKA